MGHRGWSAVLAVAAGLVAAPVARAGEIVLEEGGASLSAPEEIKCDALPVLTLRADLALLGGRREVVSRLAGQIGAALAGACPEVEALAVEGEDRGVSFRFEIAKADGWRLPGTPGAASADAPQPDIAALAAPPAEAAPAAARPDPAPQEVTAEPATASGDTAPAVAPGLSFQDLARFYRPVRSVRGHVELARHDTWTRILAARAYSERPAILDDDLMALDVARQMLNPAEFQQFLGGHAQTVGQQGDFQQLSVFDRRDLANRVRTQLRPYLDQRRQTGAIDVYHVIPLRLGEYDFDAGGFPMDAGHNRSYNAPFWQNFRVEGAMNGIVLPTALRTTVEQARELDAYLRARGDPTLYLGVFLKVTPQLPPALAYDGGYNSRAATPAGLTQIALFADKELTQVVFDFTEGLAPQQKAADQVSAELARPLLDGETLAVSLAALNDSAAPEQAVIDAYSAFGSYGAAERDLRAGAARSALDAVAAAKTVRFGGTLRLRPYDSVLGGLPVDWINLQYEGFTRIGLQLNLQAQLVPELALIPLPPEQAEALSAAIGNQNQVEIRLTADLVQGGNTAPQGEYYQAQATFAPRRVLLFSWDSSGITADRRLLADVTLPETPAAGLIPFEALKIEN